MNTPPAKPIRFKANHSVVNVSSASVQYIPGNNRRTHLRLYNTGLFVVYARFGAINQGDATGAHGDVPITAGNSAEWTIAVPVDGVFLIAPIGDVTVSILEGTPIPEDARYG